MTSSTTESNLWTPTKSSPSDYLTLLLAYLLVIRSITCFGLFSRIRGDICHSTTLPTYKDLVPPISFMDTQFFEFITKILSTSFRFNDILELTNLLVRFDKAHLRVIYSPLPLIYAQNRRKHLILCQKNSKHSYPKCYL